MNSKAEEISQSLQGFDFNMSSGLINETVKKKVNNAILLVKITNTFEADFLVSLCSREKTHPLDIELCIKYEDIVKPIGFFPFTFDNIQKIREYNNQIKIGIYKENKLEVLTPEQELCLS